jgi:hypothetical protein
MSAAAVVVAVAQQQLLMSNVLYLRKSITQLLRKLLLPLLTNIRTISAVLDGTTTPALLRLY